MTKDIKIDPYGFREYDARWLYGKDIDQAGIENLGKGLGKDEETMCAEYKVSSVEIQKISNQFKTVVEPKENQAEVS